ncbi:MAG: CbtB domain-containing protein [Nitrososphaerales archaeon]
MSTRQITIQSIRVPAIAIGILLAIFSFGTFMVGYDQGHLFSIAMGDKAYQDLYLHELFHDARHAAGFPCH